MIFTCVLDGITIHYDSKKYAFRIQNYWYDRHVLSNTSCEHVTGVLRDCRDIAIRRGWSIRTVDDMLMNIVYYADIDNPMLILQDFVKKIHNIVFCPSGKDVIFVIHDESAPYICTLNKIVGWVDSPFFHAGMCVIQKLKDLIWDYHITSADDIVNCCKRFAKYVDGCHYWPQSLHTYLLCDYTCNTYRVDHDIIYGVNYHPRYYGKTHYSSLIQDNLSYHVCDIAHVYYHEQPHSPFNAIKTFGVMMYDGEALQTCRYITEDGIWLFVAKHGFMSYKYTQNRLSDDHLRWCARHHHDWKYLSRWASSTMDVIYTDDELRTLRYLYNLNDCFDVQDAQKILSETNVSDNYELL